MSAIKNQNEAVDFVQFLPDLSLGFSMAYLRLACFVYLMFLIGTVAAQGANITSTLRPEPYSHAFSHQ